MASERNEHSVLWVVVLLFLLWEFFKNNVGGTFSLGQSVPGDPYGLPALSSQNQTNLNTENAPSPWSSVSCGAYAMPAAPKGLLLVPASATFAKPSTLRSSAQPGAPINNLRPPLITFGG